MDHSLPKIECLEKFAEVFSKHEILMSPPKRCTKAARLAAYMMMADTLKVKDWKVIEREISNFKQQCIMMMRRYVRLRVVRGENGREALQDAPPWLCKLNKPLGLLEAALNMEWLDNSAVHSIRKRMTTFTWELYMAVCADLQQKGSASGSAILREPPCLNRLAEERILPQHMLTKVWTSMYSMALSKLESVTRSGDRPCAERPTPLEGRLISLALLHDERLNILRPDSFSNSPELEAMLQLYKLMSAAQTKIDKDRKENIRNSKNKQQTETVAKTRSALEAEPCCSNILPVSRESLTPNNFLLANLLNNKIIQKPAPTESDDKSKILDDCAGKLGISESSDKSGNAENVQIPKILDNVIKSDNSLSLEKSTDEESVVKCGLPESVQTCIVPQASEKFVVGTLTVLEKDNKYALPECAEMSSAPERTVISSYPECMQKSSAVPDSAEKSSVIESRINHAIDGNEVWESTEVWALVFSEYTNRNREASLVMLQKRWYELKVMARTAMKQSFLDSQQKPHPLLLAIVKRFPQVVLSPLLPWSVLVRKSFIVCEEDIAEQLHNESSLNNVPTYTSVGELVTDLLDWSDDEPEIIEPEHEVIEILSNSDSESDTQDVNTLTKDQQRNINTIENKDTSVTKSLDKLDVNQTKVRIIFEDDSDLNEVDEFVKKNVRAEDTGNVAVKVENETISVPGGSEFREHISHGDILEQSTNNRELNNSNAIPRDNYQSILKKVVTENFYRKIAPGCFKNMDTESQDRATRSSSESSDDNLPISALGTTTESTSGVDKKLLSLSRVVLIPIDYFCEWKSFARGSSVSCRKINYEKLTAPVAVTPRQLNLCRRYKQPSAFRPRHVTRNGLSATKNEELDTTPRSVREIRKALTRRLKLPRTYLTSRFWCDSRNLQLLKCCKPFGVVLERTASRVVKKVELADIDEVRRINSTILTAQVAPIGLQVDYNENCGLTGEEDSNPLPNINASMGSTEMAEDVYVPIIPHVDYLNKMIKNLMHPSIKAMHDSIVKIPAGADGIKKVKKKNIREQNQQERYKKLDKSIREIIRALPDKKMLKLKKKKQNLDDDEEDKPLPDALEEWERQKSLVKKYFYFPTPNSSNGEKNNLEKPASSKHVAPSDKPIPKTTKNIITVPSVNDNEYHDDLFNVSDDESCLVICDDVKQNLEHEVSDSTNDTQQNTLKRQLHTDCTIEQTTKRAKLINTSSNKAQANTLHAANPDKTITKIGGIDENSEDKSHIESSLLPSLDPKGSAKSIEVNTSDVTLTRNNSANVSNDPNLNLLFQKSIYYCLHSDNTLPQGCKVLNITGNSTLLSKFLSQPQAENANKIPPLPNLIMPSPPLPITSTKGLQLEINPLITAVSSVETVELKDDDSPQNVKDEFVVSDNENSLAAETNNDKTALELANENPPKIEPNVDLSLDPPQNGGVAGIEIELDVKTKEVMPIIASVSSLAPRIRVKDEFKIRHCDNTESGNSQSSVATDEVDPDQDDFLEDSKEDIDITEEEIKKVIVKKERENVPVESGVRNKRRKVDDRRTFSPDHNDKHFLKGIQTSLKMLDECYGDEADPKDVNFKTWRDFGAQEVLVDEYANKVDAEEAIIKADITVPLWVISGKYLMLTDEYLSCLNPTFVTCVEIDDVPPYTVIKFPKSLGNEVTLDLGKKKGRDVIVCGCRQGAEKCFLCLSLAGEDGSDAQFEIVKPIRKNMCSRCGVDPGRERAKIYDIKQRSYRKISDKPLKYVVIESYKRCPVCKDSVHFVANPETVLINNKVCEKLRDKPLTYALVLSTVQSPAAGAWLASRGSELFLMNVRTAQRRRVLYRPHQQHNYINSSIAALITKLDREEVDLRYRYQISNVPDSKKQSSSTK